MAINVSVQYNGGLCLSTLLETVSYAWELTSLSMCYSQGDGFNTSLSILFYLRAVLNEDKFASNFPICPKS